MVDDTNRCRTRYGGKFFTYAIVYSAYTITVAPDTTLGFLIIMPKALFEFICKQIPALMVAVPSAQTTLLVLETSFASVLG